MPDRVIRATAMSSSRQFQSPSLIVTVDTEEEGLWSDNFKSAGNTVENTRGIPRFQECCERHGVRPTYLVDTVVASDDRSVALLKDLQDGERCEIGAHLHPWCGPPFGELLNTRNSFLCNLPPELQRQKLITLTELIEARFGRRPMSFRAGRYGLDVCGALILQDLQYKVDSSVLPFSTFANEHGPDFSAAPYQPYHFNSKDLCDAGSSRLLEVPVSVGYSRPDFQRQQRLRRHLAHPISRMMRLPGICDRLNLVRRIKFSPEMNNCERLIQLVDAYSRNGAECMVLLLHSPSLEVGYSPYAATPRRLEELYATLETLFEYCTKQQAMQCVTLSEFADRYGNRASPQCQDACSGAS